MASELFWKLFQWEKGRQNTGYRKMLLGFGFWPCPFDAYLLRFTEGDEIPPHKDSVDSGKHYRLNIILNDAIEGGEFICKNTIFENPWVKFFRSDIATHAVTKIEKGERWVLSIGWKEPE